MLTDIHILVVGAGGHGAVVVDAIQSGGLALVAVLDDSPRSAGRTLLGLPVEVPASPVGRSGGFHVAIGDNVARLRKTAEFSGAGMSPVTVVHPRAVSSRSSSIASGAFLAAGCVLGPHCSVGAGAIVNHGAVLDHDCSVGEFSHVAPNATLGGGVQVGRRSLVGAGATVLPGVRIGEGCVVGAGAVVRRDVPDGMIVVGVPAKEING